jgi:hypothetical protein
MKSKDLIINGEAAKPIIISKMVHAFNDYKILKSCGGYILTFRIDKNTAYIGVMPSIIAGQRSNHYDLKAGPETKIFLTGGINANGEISLLFKISKTELTEEIKSELRELYINLAVLLIKNGYKGPGTFDWITRKIIEESELFSPIPPTIFNLTTR